MVPVPQFWLPGPDLNGYTHSILVRVPSFKAIRIGPMGDIPGRLNRTHRIRTMVQISYIDNRISIPLVASFNAKIALTVDIGVEHESA